jgi:hypothetical protein
MEGEKHGLAYRVCVEYTLVRITTAPSCPGAFIANELIWCWPRLIAQQIEGGANHYPNCLLVNIFPWRLYRPKGSVRTLSLQNLLYVACDNDCWKTEYVRIRRFVKFFRILRSQTQYSKLYKSGTLSNTVIPLNHAACYTRCRNTVI